MASLAHVGVLAITMIVAVGCKEAPDRALWRLPKEVVGRGDLSLGEPLRDLEARTTLVDASSYEEEDRELYYYSLPGPILHRLYFDVEDDVITVIGFSSNVIDRAQADSILSRLINLYGQPSDTLKPTVDHAQLNWHLRDSVRVSYVSSVSQPHCAISVDWSDGGK